VAVIARADPKVYILRYLTSEKQFTLHYVINCTQEYSEKSTIGLFPFDIVIDNDYIAVANYLGHISLYQIPEIFIDDLIKKKANLENPEAEMTVKFN